MSGYNDKNANKASKKGVLDEQTLGYYRRISETLKEDFESDDDKVLFLDNVFKQLSQEALRVSQNQTASGIIEQLINAANRNQLTAVLQEFSCDWETACCDRFASHVTQAIILRSGMLLGQTDVQSGNNEMTAGKTLEELFDELCDFVGLSLSLYMQHTYASHIVRVVIEVLCGRPVSESLVRSRISREQQKFKGSSKAPVEFKTDPSVYGPKLYKLCCHIVGLKKLEDHVVHSLSSPVLQTVLVSLKSLDAKQCRTVCRRMSKNGKLFHKSPDNVLADNVTHSIGSHLIEQYLSVIPPETFEKVLHKRFLGNLVQMARNPVANFVLQKLISCLHTTLQLESTVDELADEFEHILALNHTGVIVRMAESCVRFGTRQKKFLKALQKAFHCYKPEERRLKLVPVLASLSTYEVVYKIPDDTESSSQQLNSTPDNQTDDCKSMVTRFNLHGSMIVQLLLQFGNPRPVIDSLLCLSVSEIASVCRDSSGCRVIESFMHSPTVGANSHELLYKRLKHTYLSIACDKWGSRTFDTLWQCASVQQQTRIVTELAKHADALRANRYGMFIHEHCAVRLFITRPDDWRQAQLGQTRKRKILHQLAEDVGGIPLDKQSKKKKVIH